MIFCWQPEAAISSWRGPTRTVHRKGVPVSVLLSLLWDRLELFTGSPGISSRILTIPGKTTRSRYTCMCKCTAWCRVRGRGRGLYTKSDVKTDLLANEHEKGADRQWRIQDFPEVVGDNYPWGRGRDTNIRFCQIFPKIALIWKNMNPHMITLGTGREGGE